MSIAAATFSRPARESRRKCPSAARNRCQREQAIEQRSRASCRLVDVVGATERAVFCGQHGHDRSRQPARGGLRYSRVAIAVLERPSAMGVKMARSLSMSCGSGSRVR